MIRSDHWWFRSDPCCYLLRFHIWICTNSFYLLQNAPLTEHQQNAIISLSHAVSERPLPLKLVSYFYLCYYCYRFNWIVIYVYDYEFLGSRECIGATQCVVRYHWG
jgi:hypothetical protein